MTGTGRSTTASPNLTGDGMPKPLPTECRARFRTIIAFGDELLQTFINGNRRDTLNGLCELETPAALAVLANMMDNAPEEIRNDLAKYLREVA